MLILVVCHCAANVWLPCVQAVKRAQADHKAAKESVKQCSLAVNSAKREIDHVTSALGAKRAEGTAGEADVLDSEEHQLLQTLKSAKIKFKRWLTRRLVELLAWSSTPWQLILRYCTCDVHNPFCMVLKIVVVKG